MCNAQQGILLLVMVVVLPTDAALLEMMRRTPVIAIW
jgi:hypothetical protein